LIHMSTPMRRRDGIISLSSATTFDFTLSFTI
jgi:hypothetical protein